MTFVRPIVFPLPDHQPYRRRRCNDKVRYADCESADAAVETMNQLFCNTPSRAYQCGICGGWHLTTTR